MSVRNALQFIVRLRADETLRKRLVCPDDAPELDSFVELGGKIGQSFTIEELRTAHKHDWGMRYLFITVQIFLPDPDPGHETDAPHFRTTNGRRV